MRREGYEFQVSRPEVITRDDRRRQCMNRSSTCIIDTTEEFVGTVTELVGGRRAQMLDMVNDGRGNVRLEFAIPTRGLIGLRNAFLTATKGNGVMGSRLIGFEPCDGTDPNHTHRMRWSPPKAAMTLAHGLANAQERGDHLHSSPATRSMKGMIVGQQPRQGDLPVNVCRAKKLTNMRASNSDIAVKLTPAVMLSLEQSLDFLSDDELPEVTPKSYRLRKRLLSQTNAPKNASVPPSRPAEPIEPEEESEKFAKFFSAFISPRFSRIFEQFCISFKTRG